MQRAEIGDPETLRERSLIPRACRRRITRSRRIPNPSVFCATVEASFRDWLPHRRSDATVPRAARAQQQCGGDLLLAGIGQIIRDGVKTTYATVARFRRLPTGPVFGCALKPGEIDSIGG